MRSSVTFQPPYLLCFVCFLFVCTFKHSTAASHQGCEEGSVEPEATTGGDCSDDTLPVGNGDPQQYVHVFKYL